MRYRIKTLNELISEYGDNWRNNLKSYRNLGGYWNSNMDYLLGMVLKKSFVIDCDLNEIKDITKYKKQIHIKEDKILNNNSGRLWVIYSNALILLKPTYKSKNNNIII